MQMPRKKKFPTLNYKACIALWKVRVRMFVRSHFPKNSVVLNISWPSGKVRPNPSPVIINDETGDNISMFSS